MMMKKCKQKVKTKEKNKADFIRNVFYKNESSKILFIFLSNLG